MKESCCIWMGHVAYGWVNFHLNRPCCTWRSPVAPVRVMLHVNESCHRRSEMGQHASINGSYHTRLSDPYIIGLSDVQNRCICLSSLHMYFWAKWFLRRTYIRLAREAYQTRVWWHMRPIRYASVALYREAYQTRLWEPYVVGLSDI